MHLKKPQESDDFCVGEEIEWPALSKIVSTAEIVLGVIAESTVVLLTVNGILAVLCDVSLRVSRFFWMKSVCLKISVF